VVSGVRSTARPDATAGWAIGIAGGMPNSPRPDAPRVQWCMGSPFWSCRGRWVAGLSPVGGRWEVGHRSVPGRRHVTPYASVRVPRRPIASARPSVASAPRRHVSILDTSRWRAG
jgi:hypothetical protein